MQRPLLARGQWSKSHESVVYELLALRRCLRRQQGGARRVRILFQRGLSVAGRTRKQLANLVLASTNRVSLSHRLLFEEMGS